MNPKMISTGALTSSDTVFGAQLPNPDGWYCLGFSRELKPGMVLTRKFMDSDVVLYRTSKGVLRAARPYCPHLGAHLGLGKVEGESIVCAFHAFAYGPDGTCTRTAYGARVPKARLGFHAVRETNTGIIMVWHHHAGLPPTWEIPDLPVQGYSPLVHTMYEMAGHPHDAAENSADFGHFAPVHGFVLDGIPEISFDGPSISVPFAFFARIPLFGNIRVKYETQVHGLGYLAADVHLPLLGPIMRVFVLPVVVVPGRIQLRMAAQLALPGPRFLPPRLRDGVALQASRLLARVALRFGAISVARGDAPIWATKQYLARPRLAEGDGPIPQFRRWASQFYPEEFNGDDVATTDQGVHNDQAESRP